MPNPGDDGTCFELFDSVDAEFDPSSGAARRIFVVGQTEITPGMPLGWPNYREEHPRYPGLFCDKTGVQERIAPGATKMYALYSTNGRFTTVLRRPGVDLQRGYLRIDSERAEVNVPFLIATARTIPIYTTGDDGRQVLTDTGRSFEWIDHPRKSPFYRTIWSRSVDVENLTSTQRDYITAQTGQIHTFPDGNKYMMLAPQITQLTARTYRLVYQWITEPTLPYPGYPPRPGEAGFPMPSPPITDPVLSEFYQTANDGRPPFYNYQVVPGVVEYSDITTGARISIPRVFVVDGFPDKRNTPTGWITLPGSPLDGI